MLFFPSSGLVIRDFSSVAGFQCGKVLVIKDVIYLTLRSVLLDRYYFITKL
jgi:hypothetical protein